jgi:hypothetical protein
VLGAEAPDEAAWRRQLRVVEPLYWHDFGADLHTRVFTVLLILSKPRTYEGRPRAV